MAACRSVCSIAGYLTRIISALYLVLSAFYCCCICQRPQTLLCRLQSCCKVSHSW